MEKYQPDMGNQFTTGEVNVVTRSMQNERAATSGLSSNKDVIDQSSNLHTDADSDDAFIFTDIIDCELFSGKHDSVNQLIEEQMNDETLNNAFSLARQGKGCYVISDGLFQNDKYGGKKLMNLVVPHQRRDGVLKLAHSKLGR
jgi:hypothetical protein